MPKKNHPDDVATSAWVTKSAIKIPVEKDVKGILFTSSHIDVSVEAVERVNI